MKILGIETSCDETSAAVVEDGRIILSNVVSTQIPIHARYGGVVPEVASRQHLITIIPVIEQTLLSAQMNLSQLDAIAVTYGPGLAGSLLIGVNSAKAIAMAQNLPLIGINHLEGHIYANWLDDLEPVFPCLCLIISGGHSDIVIMKGHGEITKIGQTRDDAAGEAFDKGARIMGLGYPGGPEIERAANTGTATINLPKSVLKGSDDFSFSGIKTALLHFVQTNSGTNEYQIPDIAASYQQAIIDMLISKTIKVAERLNVKQILLSGGVAANKTLCTQFRQKSPLPLHIPVPKLCTDNAAMIASCGFFNYKTRINPGDELDVLPNLHIGEH
jgi:N6-L-threonylcarbamoyladenine synthase